MNRVATPPMKRANRLEPSEKVIRQVRREQSEVLRRLVRIQSETLRGRPPQRFRPRSRSEV